MYVSKQQQKTEVLKLLRKAKKAYERAQRYESDFYALLREYAIDLDAPAPHACNAEQVNDAVSTYLIYNEGVEKEVIADIFAAQINSKEGE